MIQRDAWSMFTLLALAGCDPYKVEFPDDTAGCEASDEVCNGVDDDCDGAIDEALSATWYADGDGDGYGDPSTATISCEAPEGYLDHAGDCDDADPTVRGCDWSGAAAIADASDAVLIGEAAYDQAGFSVASAGDVNGDGVDDALVATNRTNEDQGGLYLVTGPISGEQDLADATAVLRQRDTVEVDHYLRGVGALGDVDGDGYDEIAVGDFMAPDGETAQGAIWLWSGTVSGANDLESADVIVSGEARSDVVGVDPAVSVDLDGDGQQDLVVSSIRAQSGPGGAYGFLGPLSGDYTLSDAQLTVLGTDTDAQVGSAVAGGDFDGDGQDDLALGARYTEVAGRVKSGAIYLVAGPRGSDALDVADADGAVLSDAASAQLGEELVGPGDLNGDGYDDLLASAPYDGLTSRGGGTITLYAGPLDGTLTSADAVARFGAADPDFYTCTAFDAGDLNMDGVGDLVVANESGARGWGAAYVVYGPLSGELALDDGDADATFEGDALTASWVMDAAIGGDFNVDGWADLLIGTAYAVGGTTSETGAGRAHVLWGGP